MFNIMIMGMTEMKSKRFHAKMTQQVLGKMTGMAHSDISKIERGEKAAWPRAVEQIAIILDCTVGELFDDKGMAL